jgi:hypothetical protein
MTNTPHSGDRIFLRGLTCECIIGFIDWERRVRQTVVLDLELPVDCARAAASDEVAEARRDPGAAPGAHHPRGIRAALGAHLAQQARRHPRLA